MEKVDFDVLWFLYIDIVWLFDNIIIVPVIVSGVCYLNYSFLCNGQEKVYGSRAL